MAAYKPSQGRSDEKRFSFELPLNRKPDLWIELNFPSFEYEGALGSRRSGLQIYDNAVYQALARYDHRTLGEL